MSYLFILLSFLFVTQTTEPKPGDLSISTTGEVELPADRIQFVINVNAEAATPQAAYNLHQQREKALVQLLDKYNIDEKNIRYEPVSISEKPNYNKDSDQKPTYTTSQTVSLTMQDFDVYEKIQIGLIQHDFDNFSGSFGTSDLKKGENEALKKAIQQAKDKAQLIAGQTGVSLGNITHISYNYNQVQPYAHSNALMKEQARSGSLLKYNQTVTVQATISIQYALLNK